MRTLPLFFAVILLFVYSCDDQYLETQPTNQVSGEAVFQTADGVQTLLDGVLRDMRSQHGSPNQHDQFGVKAIDLCIDLMGEDIVPETFHWFGVDYIYRNRSAVSHRPLYVWSLFYRIIYNVNSVIHNVDGVSAQDESRKDHLKAQALALRSYAYFQLIQLFQHTYKGHEDAPGVPLYTSTDIEGKARSTVSEVYDQIVQDLDESIQLFEGSNHSQRHISDPSVNVAKGLRARVALVMQDWETAAQMADEARQGYDLMPPDQFSAGFDNSTEQNWMWGLEVNNEQSTTYASWFSHMDWTIGGYCGYGIIPKSYNLKLYHQMDNGDVRKQLIDASSIETGRLIPYKFAAGGDKGFAADYVMMRPEEMVLIEAEARAMLEEYPEAAGLLEELRNMRYDSPVSVSLTGDALLEEIYTERRIELWGEGFAGLDIKRLKLPVDRTDSNHKPDVSTVMTLPAESSKLNYQIPQEEIDANPNIGEEDQNP